MPICEDVQREIFTLILQAFSIAVWCLPNGEIHEDSFMKIFCCHALLLLFFFPSTGSTIEHVPCGELSLALIRVALADA